jgi:hypothetical protein
MEAKKLTLFLGDKLGGHENVVAKSDSDVEMLACTGAIERDRWLRECVCDAGKAGSASWTDPSTRVECF